MRQRGPHLARPAGRALPPRGEGDSRGAELADVISRLRRAMRRAARAADPVGKLSVAQLELLSCLAENPGARPGQLARLLRIAPSSEATLASGLRRAGLITRSGGENDRRTASLSLTEAGAGRGQPLAAGQRAAAPVRTDRAGTGQPRRGGGRAARTAGPGGADRHAGRRPARRAYRASARLTPRPGAAVPSSAGPGGIASFLLIRDGHQFHRPSSTTVDGTSRVRTRKVSIRMPSARPSPMSRIWLPPDPLPATSVSTRNVPASTSPAEVIVEPVAPSARVTASRSGRWRASSRIRRHHQDVVVLAQREQEDEHQERHEEHQAAAVADLDEDEHRQAQRRQVGDPDRDDQVQRRHQAAQHQREQDPDRQDRDGDDVLEVTVGDAADVVEGRCLAAERRVGCADRLAHRRGRGAQRRHHVHRPGGARVTRLQAGLVQHGPAVRADVVRRGPVGGVERWPAPYCRPAAPAAVAFAGPSLRAAR